MKDLLGQNLQFILFGGKGGVGKTTMAAASAAYFARQFPKRRFLIFTTDPAPSLADSFDQSLSNDPQIISGIDNLFALEISAKKELAKFKKQYGKDIFDILAQGTYLSDEEVDQMFTLDIPGIDEVMGLKRIMDFMEDDAYDAYFLDTAPTGHTLRLLTLPDLLDDWIKFLASLRWKYHAMIKQFSRGTVKRVEQADTFLLEMKKTVKRVQKLLTDPKKTTFVMVTIPEAMAVAETKDLARDLKKDGIATSQVIINNIVPRDENAFLAKRRKTQDTYIKDIRKAFPAHVITEVELQAEDIRGTEKLQALGDALFQSE
jgi:arsenite/tail-anchored protein-transporting ATPase